MKSVSLIQEAQRRGEQLSFWISLILSAVFALISCISLAYSQITAVQDDFLTNEKNFSYWIETGDVFQLDRALSNFVKVHSQVKEIELEKEGFEIASLRSKNYSQKILSKKIVFERKLAGARAKIFYDISFKEILYIPILFFLIYLILRFSIKNLMTRFGRSILNPLTDFSLSIGGASSLEEIQGLTHSKGKILELDALIEKLSLLGFRVSEAERKASKVKELEFVNRISKQVAHDIRSPLTAIEAIVKSKGGLDVQKLSLLEMAAGQIKEIAEDLLGQSRSPLSISSERVKSQNSQSLGKESSDSIISAVEKVIEAKKLEYSKRKIKFVLYQYATTKLGVCCQIEELIRVLSNLINNSVEAMPNGGLISVDVLCEADEFMIEVRDTGIGISREHLDQLFQEGATFGKENGNGLGLFSAKVRVEEWGGRLAINSEPNKGSRVRIALRPVA